MQKAKELVEELLNAYASLPIKKKPKLEWKIDRFSQTEKVVTQLEGGLLTLEADCERNLCFALQQAFVYLLSGHWEEHLTKPLYPLRMVWLMDGEGENLCRRLTLLGYNAVLLDAETKIDYSLFSSFGIKIYLKPKRESLEAQISTLPLDVGIFWESHLLHEEFYQNDLDSTYLEIVCKEMKRVEEGLGGRSLIFYVPTSNVETAEEQSLWLSDLCEEGGKRTVIAFSAVAGDATLDHLSSHPFWFVLRKDRSRAPLIPLINVGAVNQGECLWPALSLDLMERFFPRLDRTRFKGAICLTNTIPEEKGLLHLSLWVAAQALWHGATPSLAAETWVLAYRPDFNDPQVFSKAKELVLKMGALRGEGEGKRQIAESMEAELALLDLKFKGSVAKEKPTLSDYYTYFALDMRNLLTQFSSHTPSIEQKEGFWTKGKSVLEKPNGGKTAIMKQIFLENQ